MTWSVLSSLTDFLSHFMKLHFLSPLLEYEMVSAGSLPGEGAGGSFHCHYKVGNLQSTDPLGVDH